MTLRCGHQLLHLSTPIVMGVLNLTPDSFYDGGHWNKDPEIYLNQVEKMLKEGAEIIDIGGLSSRPGAAFISETEELGRVIPAIEQICKYFPKTVISIDTWRAKVAQEAATVGASLINDISGAAFDPALLQTTADLQLPYILMHIKGTPQTMQQNPTYEDLITEIIDYFIQRLALLRNTGVRDIVIDPGFGFGKTLEQNYQLLAHLSDFQCLGLPIMVGLSRKSMIYKFLDSSPQDALNGTTAAHVLALERGAKILRAHDVKQAVEAIKIWSFCQK